jgi:hypothetical protein
MEKKINSENIELAIVTRADPNFRFVLNLQFCLDFIFVFYVFLLDISNHTLCCRFCTTQEIEAVLSALPPDLV